jgi:hypothetical protein
MEIRIVLNPVRLSILVMSVLVLGFLIGSHVDITPANASDSGNSSGGQHMGHPGKTIFVDIGIASKRIRGAKRLTSYHQKMALEGWTVIDVEPYTENSDLQGYFVTYVQQ